MSSAPSDGRRRRRAGRGATAGIAVATPPARRRRPPAARELRRARSNATRTDRDARARTARAGPDSADRASRVSRASSISTTVWPLSAHRAGDQRRERRRPGDRARARRSARPRVPSSRRWPRDLLGNGTRFRPAGYGDDLGTGDRHQPLGDLHHHRRFRARPSDARVSSHDRGRASTSPARVLAPRLPRRPATTATTTDARRPLRCRSHSLSDRSAARHSESTATGRPPTSATRSSIASSAAVTISACHRRPRLCHNIIGGSSPDPPR